jgi:multidrug resistance efflux pump
MNNELRASQLAWKKLRKILFRTALLAVAGTVAVYLLSGGSVLLSADGLVTRQRVEVASPWQDSRVREIYVHPGDWVEAGQKVAVVESAAISRSLADLAAERARISSRKAQLEARKVAISTLLPLAQANADQAQTFLGKLKDADAKGLALFRSLHEMSAASLQASDRLLSLQSEQASFEAELETYKAALEQVSTAYDNLQRIYDDGVLRAPASGYVGGKVALVGEVLSAGNDKVASIYAGTSFVLAYIPETYLFDVEEGQEVAIKAHGETIPGHIEKVLPVAESLPPEFQLPTKARGRGQLVRVAFSDEHELPVEQKVQVTRCHLGNCRLGLSEMIRAGIRGLGGLEVQISEIGGRIGSARLAGGAS